MWPYVKTKKKKCRPTWFFCESWAVIVAVIHCSVGKWLTGSLEDLEWRCCVQEVEVEPVTAEHTVVVKENFCVHLVFGSKYHMDQIFLWQLTGWPNKFGTHEKISINPSKLLIQLNGKIQWFWIFENLYTFNFTEKCRENIRQNYNFDFTKKSVKITTSISRKKL